MRWKTRSACFQSRNKRHSLFCISLLIAVLLGGCAGTPKESMLSLRIGVALYNQDDTFISLLELERLALECEGDGGTKINFSIMDGRINQTLQNQQVEQLIELDCDVLCVNIVDRTAAAVLIDKAQAADIPIIFFNREPVKEDINRWQQVYYIGAHGAESGKQQGGLALEAWNQVEGADRNGDGVLQYVMLEGEPGHQDALLRTEYSIAALTEGDVPIEKLDSASANWDRAQASDQLKRWIELYGTSIEMVFANNDDMELGAIDAYQERNTALQDCPLIFGIDATPAAMEVIEAGLMHATVKNPSEDIAKNMLDIPLALVQDVPLEGVIALQDGHYAWLPYYPVKGAKEDNAFYEVSVKSPNNI